MYSDFDKAALNYDSEFTFSKIGMAQRAMVYSHLKPFVRNNGSLNILELNCGTGEDALFFGKLGHKVIATDSSKTMIDVCRSKQKLENVTFKIKDIKDLDENSFDEKFDFIFSNFGGFNCIEKSDIKSFFEMSESLLNSKGKIILVIMSTNCLWEQIYFFLKGNFKLSRRRRSKTSILANVNGNLIKTWYHSPEDILRLAMSGYKATNLIPIGFAIPPSYLEGSILSKKPILNFLTFIEKLAPHKSLANYADHFLIEFTRTD